MSAETSLMRCDDAAAALAVWDPAVDLDEDVAVHVGACLGCRATFDARFPPIVERPVAVSPATPRRASRSAALAVAAAVAVAVGTVAELWSGGASASDDLFPPECPVEHVAVALECPPG